jgi:hypothetical protein
MIVNDLDIVCTSILPTETKPVFFVDPDAVLPFPIAYQGLKTIARRDREIPKTSNRCQLRQLTFCHGVDAGRKSPRCTALIELSRIPASKAYNHLTLLTRCDNNAQ